MFQKNLLHIVTVTAFLLGGYGIVAAQGKRNVTQNTVEPIIFVDTTVRINDAVTAPAQPVTVEIEADSQGTENSFVFSISYDTAVVSNPIVAFGTDMQTGTISSDTSQPGLVGISVSLPPGQALQAGTRQIVTIQFDVADQQDGNSPLTFGDTPMVRDIRDTSSGVITGSYDDGLLTILGPTAGPAVVGGYVTNQSGYGIPNVRVSVSGSSGATFSTLTNQFGYYAIEGIESGEVYVVSVRHKNYIFPVSYRVLNVLEDIVDCNFAGGIEQ
jgi:hypothetical protein